MHNLREMEDQLIHHYTKLQTARQQNIPLASVALIYAATAYFSAEFFDAKDLVGYAVLASLISIAIYLTFYGLFLWHRSKFKEIKEQITALEKSKEEKS